MTKKIDPDFIRNRAIAGKAPNGAYEIWGPVNPPEQLGIHGTMVAVDHDLCVADGACLDCCEVNVFEWVQSPGHPTSSKKSVPVREKDCLYCTACESVCPALAIRIWLPGVHSIWPTRDKKTAGIQVALIFLALGLSGYFYQQDSETFTIAFLIMLGLIVYTGWALFRQWFENRSIEFDEDEIRLTCRVKRWSETKVAPSIDVREFKMSEDFPGLERYQVRVNFSNGRSWRLAQFTKEKEASTLIKELQDQWVVFQARRKAKG